LKRQAPYRTCAELRDEKIFESLHIFLASKLNIRILHNANSLQAFFVERERGLLMEDATKN